MRSLLLLLIVTCFCACFRPAPPDKAITQFLFDREDLLAPPEEAAVDSLLRDYEKRTSNELVILTTSGNGKDTSLTQYTRHFSDSLSVGKREKNNGLVIAFSKAQLQLFTLAQSSMVGDTATITAVQDSAMMGLLNERHYFQAMRAGALAFMAEAARTAQRDKQKKKT